MVQRTAEASVQRDACSEGGSNPVCPSGEASALRQDFFNDRQTLRCSVKKCPGELHAGKGDYSFRTGLETWVCSSCGHRGFRSREGVISLFRCGQEFKFSYGPSTHTITVVLSSAAVNLWSTHGVTDEQLAKMAAEWTLLCGNLKKPVTLGISSEEFADFYLYFCAD
ncbi:MAG: hypothetical protein JSR62_01100 [Nitrospira sp.]|nr:hypothetical protein [Nitrospira sp.]